HGEIHESALVFFCEWRATGAGPQAAVGGGSRPRALLGKLKTIDERTGVFQRRHSRFLAARNSSRQIENRLMNLKDASTLITGASGFVGRNLVELLRARGLRPITPTRAECDLLEQEQIRRLLADEKPDIVFHAAGVVGGN